VLGQLVNRVQHALRAFTPRDQKAVKAAAQTFRQNPKLNTETVLTELAVGEALVSMLDENGSPEVVERAKIVPPRSQVGAITPDQRKQMIDSSVLAGHYEKAIDRESAYEKLQARAGEKAQSSGAPPVIADESTTQRPQSSVLAEALGTVTAAFQPTVGPRGGVHDSFAASMAKSAMRAASSQLGRQIARGLLGGILGGTSGRRR
jgi:DNA helicase HerA-like ATPase